VAQTFDPEVPSIARTYDYLLGGKDNFPVDRAVASIYIEKYPGAVQIALDNRACLVRAVGYMTRDLGLDQFLDLGSGLPTANNVHQVAQRINPQARVAYVDNDPQVLAHGRALLAENARTVVIAADLREPDLILSDPEILDLIDLSRPVGIIASAVLHHILDAEDPLALIRKFRDAVPAGSYLFVSHFRAADSPELREIQETLLDAFGRGQWRTIEEITEYFGDMTLIEPGVVPSALWRPEEEPGDLTPWQQLIAAGLGGK
jgi:SAM-dependent methyltransferase